MKKISWKTIFIGMVGISIGIVAGGYLFSNTQPRSFLTFHQCEESCLSASELAGLVISVGIEKVPDGVSLVAVKESELAVVIRHPFPLAELHYVAIPKKDIRDAADLTAEDQAYVMEAYALMGELIREQDLDRYKIISNGPGFQGVNYLHFNLVADVDRE